MPNENNNFSRNILKLYQTNPDAIRIVFEYNLVNCPINLTDSNGNNILHHVVKNNDVKTLTAIVNYINYYDSLSHSVINHQNKHGDTPMHIAVRNQNEHIAKILDSAGADLKIKNHNGEVIASSEERPSDMMSETLNKFRHLSNNNDSIDLSDLDDSNFKPYGNKHSSCSDHYITNTFIGTTDSERFINELAKELSKSKKVRVPSVAKAYNMLTHNLQGGGANESETSFVVKFADTNHNQDGGAKHRHKRSSKRSNSPGRSTPNESSEIHDQVVQKLKEIMGNEEDARAIKAGLYNLVKEQNPTLSNLDRAKKMLEHLKDEKIMKELKNRINEYRKILAEVRANKEKQGKLVGQSNKDFNKGNKPRKANKATSDSE